MSSWNGSELKTTKNYHGRNKDVYKRQRMGIIYHGDLFTQPFIDAGKHLSGAAQDTVIFAVLRGDLEHSLRELIQTGHERCV